MQELLGQDRVARHFAHHDQLQAPRAALQAVFGEQFNHGFGLSRRAHERYHDPDIVQAHLLARIAQGPAFEFKTGLEFGREIARGAAIADHGVFFVRLVMLAADQVGIFIGLEIRQPDDHRMGGKGRAQRGDALDQFFNVVIDGVAIGMNPLVDHGL